MKFYVCILCFLVYSVAFSAEGGSPDFTPQQLKVLVDKGEYRKAVIALRDSLDNAERSGRSESEVDALRLSLREGYRYIGDKKNELVLASLIAESYRRLYRAEIGREEPDSNKLFAIANVFKGNGNYADAELAYSKALNLDGVRLQKNGLELRDRLFNLAEVYIAQGKYSEAEAFFGRADELLDKAMDGSPLAVVKENYRHSGIRNRALFYLRHGNAAEAARGYQAALEHLARYPELKERDIFAVRRNLLGLARAYGALGNVVRAETVYRELIDSYGTYDRDVVGFELGELLEKKGDFPGAAHFYSTSLESIERQKGHKHPALVHALLKLASINHSSGRYATAESQYERALLITAESMGLHHQDIEVASRGLSDIYRRAGREYGVEVILDRAKSSHERGE